MTQFCKNVQKHILNEQNNLFYSGCKCFILARNIQQNNTILGFFCYLLSRRKWSITQEKFENWGNVSSFLKWFGGLTNKKMISKTIIFRQIYEVMKVHSLHVIFTNFKRKVLWTTSIAHAICKLLTIQPRIHNSLNQPHTP